ncbi:MAG TPA: prepilin-type N-terminal cleavage/methylation domain-containing protein [Candidatus Sulfotelmatobacter sp.]|jgi:prepilin-type N-terminal cleavage/methylation domain-containing protein
MKSKLHRGFSLLEMLIVVSIGLILAGVGFIAMMPVLNQTHLNNAYDTTLMVLRNTRNQAITQSHEYYVYFNPVGFAAGTIQVQYQPPAVNGTFPPLQQVTTYTLPPDITFAVRAGFPSSPTTVPDGFGTGANAIDFGQGLTGAPFNYVVFYPDGSSRDGSALNGYSLGNYNNGVIYLTRASDTIYASRAITVWGATGRVRGWRLNNAAGIGTWVQQ